MCVRRFFAFAAFFAIAVLLAPFTSAQAQEPFLPGYYDTAFTLGGRKLLQRNEDAQFGFVRRAYATDDRAIELFLEKIFCERPHCNRSFDRGRAYVNESFVKPNGRFLASDDAWYRAEWLHGSERRTTFGVRLPRGVLYWTYSLKPGAEADMEAVDRALREMANRQRYEDALGNETEMALWGAQIHEHARALQRAGRKDEAAKVLADLLAASPANYAAHMDFAMLTPDQAAARASARAVLNGSEDADLVAKAESVLGTSPLSFDSLPALGAGETGLQLILVPLAPCDPRLLIEAGKVYEKITGVPVKVRRLPEAWRFGAPERLPDQLRMQRMILQQRGTSVDFTGWTLDRYREEVTASHASADPLTRFFIQDFIGKLDSRPAQYRVDPYLERFLDLLAKYRSSDRRTMYVGVTASSIYAGDANYIFSSYMARQQGGASILSYSMMTAIASGEKSESRPVLVENIAKELVPASLKSLGIPRASDPTDPHSEGSGVLSLSVKTLTLSPPTRQALDKFR